MRRSRLVMIGTVVSIVAAFGVAPAAQAAEDYFLAVQSGTTGPAIRGETLDAISSPRGGPSSSTRSTGARRTPSPSVPPVVAPEQARPR